MTWSVYQHWDPLKVCIVGRSYPPEFYSWINDSKVRSLFERIAIETEEDYLNIIKKLNEFGVTVFRPELPKHTFSNNQYVKPPMTPRDYTVMIGDLFYTSYALDSESRFLSFYTDVKDPSWQQCNSIQDYYNLPEHIKKECNELHHFDDHVFGDLHISNIINQIKIQGNEIKENCNKYINGAMVSRIGKDLYFGTLNYNDDIDKIKRLVDKEFPNTRNHIVNTGGHGDGTYCPVCPGLIISLHDVPTYEKTFPGWEVVYLPGQSWNKIRPFLELKRKNDGKWWIPGFESDQSVIDIVETWLGNWVGYVEETVFDVNMLIIDPKNVLVFNYNKQVFSALERYGITPHIVPFRHRYFWDGGIHCVTSDLHRVGTMQDYFPERTQ